MPENEKRQLNQSFYHAFAGDASATLVQLDEMVIKNMIDALNNPVVFASLSDEDKALLTQVIKSHVVTKAGLISQIQKDRNQSSSRGL